MPAWPASVWSLLAVNFWALTGVLSFGWDVFVLGFVYWAENAVIGVVNLPRLALARPSDGEGRGIAEKCVALPFFVFHFGVFTTVHGFVISALWKSFGGGTAPGAPAGLFTLLGTEPLARSWPLWTAVALLLVSHGHSLVLNTILREEGRRVTVKQQMKAPYTRVLVMHLAVFVGAAGVLLAGLPRLFTAGLVFLKMGLDVHFHLRERARLQ